MSGKRPSDDMQRQSKRRPGEQLTKDNFEDDDDEPAVDPGTWGKADAATMARRKVIKVRRGAGGAPADQQAPAAAAAAADNPFAGVALAPTAANPFAGIAMTASAADQGDAQKASEEQPPAAEAAASAAAEQADATPAAEAAKAPEVAKQLEAASPAAAAGAAAAAAAAEEQPSVQEQQEAPKPADKPADTTGDQQAEQAGDKPADKAEDKPAAASTSGGFGSLAAGSTGGFGGIAGSTGGFGGFGSSTGGFAGFGAGGGFGGFAATAGKEGEGSGSLFGNFKAPPPGSSFGFGSAGGKPKDVEEGGEGEEGADENGQELFGGPEVAPVVQLNEVPKQTGEEGESNVFAAEGKLYEYVDGKDWKERGRGELRLNVHQGNHRARLVMRQKGSQRLLLNANLYPKMPTSKMVGGKGATFAAVNAAPPVPAEGAAKAEKEGEGADGAAASAAASTTAMKTYAFKAKSAAEIDDFLAKVDQYKARSVESSAGEGDKQANPDGWGDR